MLKGLNAQGRIIVLAGLASGASLLGAWGFETIGGLYPCELCLWQRWPHRVNILIMLIWVIAGVHIPARAMWVIALQGLIFFTASGLAFYHLGIEQHWWQGYGCAAPDLPTGTDFATMVGTPVVRCDQPAGSFAGLSLAGWHGVITLVMGLAILYYIIVYVKYGRQEADTGKPD